MPVATTSLALGVLAGHLVKTTQLGDPVGYLDSTKSLGNGRGGSAAMHVGPG